MPLGAILEKGQDFLAEGTPRKTERSQTFFRVVAGVGESVLEAENQSH